MLTQVLQNGHHQAVRIPADFHFDVDTVEILRAENGDIILRSTTSKNIGDELFALFDDFDDGFIRAVEDRDNTVPQERETL